MTLEELGALLRDERERRGLTIEEVAMHLKYGAGKLRALEDGDTASMPVPYVKGFIRAYATFLGLAASEVVEAMRVVGDERPTAEEIRAAHQVRQGMEPVEGGSSMTASLVAAGVLVAALAGGTWAAFQSGMLDGVREHLPESIRESLPRKEADVPEFIPDTRRPVVAPAAPADAAGEKAEKTASAPPPAVTRPAPVVTSVQNPETNAGVAEAGVAAPAQPATAQAPAADDGISVLSGGESVPAVTGAAKEHKVVLTASRTCRIRSTADDADTRAFSLRRGDVFVLTFDRCLELALDDPGCVRIRQDGRSFPVPARRGGTTLVFPAGR